MYQRQEWERHMLFLSLIPPSNIVVSNRELANISFPFVFSIPSNPQTHNSLNMDMEIDTPRGWSNVLSTNNSRESLVYSNVFCLFLMIKE